MSCAPSRPWDTLSTAARCPRAPLGSLPAQGSLLLTTAPACPAYGGAHASLSSLPVLAWHPDPPPLSLEGLKRDGGTQKQDAK